MGTRTVYGSAGSPGYNGTYNNPFGGAGGAGGNASYSYVGRAGQTTVTTSVGGGAGGAGGAGFISRRHHGSGGTGGNGGYATASTYTNQASSGTLQANAYASGGAGGAAGETSSAYYPYKERGGAGGNASATATANNSIGAAIAVASAVGGSGGIGSGADGGYAGAGGDATINSVTATSSNAAATAKAYAYGGAAGGTATIGAVIASGYSAYAKAIQTGGLGGGGYSGGAGAASTMSNVVFAESHGGAEELIQIAIGGRGGNAYVAGGAGSFPGAGSSSLTFNDLLNAQQSASVTGTAIGEGGYGYSRAGGGGYAAISITGAHYVHAIGGAYGGTGGAARDYLSEVGGNATGTASATSTGGRAYAQFTAVGGVGGIIGYPGGSAQATSSATAAGLASDFTALAIATANGGKDGNGGYYGQGSATATASTTTANGQESQATATGNGSTDNFTATANTSGTGVLRGLTDSASLLGSGTMTTVAYATLNGSFPGFASTTDNAYSSVDGDPLSSEVNTLLAGESNVAPVLGTTTTAVDFADGTQGAYESSVSGTQSYSSSETFDVDATGLAGDLVLGLLSPQATGSGLTDATLTVTVGGGAAQVFNETSLAAANTFFTDDALNLGSFTASSSLVVTVSLSETFSGAGSGYAIDYLIGTTAGGHGPPLITAPGTLTLGINHSAGVPGVSIAENGAQNGEMFTVVLDDVNGVLGATQSGSDTITQGAGDTQLTITGALTDVNASLATLTDVDGTAGSDTITLNSTDSFGASATVENVAVTVNNAPVIAVPTSETVGVGKSALLTGLSVSETGSPGSPETYTVVVGDTVGVLTAAISGSDTVSTSNGGKTLTITGLIGDVNASLAALSDSEPTAGAGVDTLTLNATDSFGNVAAQETVGISVNGLPAITVPGAQVEGVGKARSIVGISVAESGNSGLPETFTATLSDTTGNLTVGSDGAALTGNGTTAVTISGTLAEVNASLASLSDTDTTAGTDTIMVATSDSFGNVASQTIGVTINGLPTFAATMAQSVGVGKTGSITGIALSETGDTNSPETFSATLTDTHGNLSVTANGATITGLGTRSLTIAGTLAEVDAALASLTDTSATLGADTITLNARDSFGDVAAQKTLDVTVNGLPSITVPGAQVLGVNKARAITGVSVSETGSTGAPESFTAVLIDTQGKLTATADGATLTGSGTTSLTIAGTLAEVNAALATLKDTDATTGADTIKLYVTDSLDNVATQKTIGVTVDGLPTISAPTAQAVGVGKARAIIGVTLSETGGTGAPETFTARLSDKAGSLTVTANGATVTGNGSKSVTITGSLIQVDAALATLSVTEAAVGTDTISLNASDSFGNVALQQTIGVTVNGVPSIAVPASQIAGVGKALAIAGIKVSESGSTGSPETFTATLSDKYGELSVIANGSTVTGNGTTSLRLSGSLTEVNAALASLSDTDPTAGSDTVTVNASDNLANAATQETFVVTVNGSPVLTVPGAQTLPNGVATAIKGATLTESGVTGAPERFTATLADTSGKLSVTANGATITGNGSKAVTITGLLTQVDAALATLTDTDSTIGTDTIKLSASDSFGNVAAQKTLSATVNGLPSIVVPGSQTIGVGKVRAISGITVAESGNTGPPETFTATLRDKDGDLTVAADGATLTGDGTTSLTISGSLTQVNASLATLSDVDAIPGADTITVHASDSFGQVAAQQVIGVTVNGLPTVAVPVSQTVGVGKPQAIAGIKVSETGSTSAPESFTVTLSDKYGKLSVAAIGATVAGNDTTSLKLSGSLTQVDAALASLSDTDATVGADTITLNVSDSFGNAATQEKLSVTANGLPALTVPGAQKLKSGVATAIKGVTLTESGITGTPESFTASLADTYGKLTVSANGTTVTGDGTKSVTIKGSLTQVDAALASLSDTDSTVGSDTIKLNASDSFGNVAAQKTIGVTVTSAAAISSDSLLTNSQASTLMIPEGVTLNGYSGAPNRFGILGDKTDHLTATLHLLNQYASQFGVSASDYSSASDKALGMPGTDFDIEHAGNLMIAPLGHHGVMSQM